MTPLHSHLGLISLLDFSFRAMAYVLYRPWALFGDTVISLLSFITVISLLRFALVQSSFFWDNGKE